MKKPWMIIFLFSLFAFEAGAQLDNTRLILKESPLTIKTQTHQLVLTLTVTNSLISEEVNALNRLMEEKWPEVMPLPTLQQPKIKLLDERRKFILQQQDFPVWQRIQRRVDPIDIPVWNAVKVTKDL